ncbi:MAG: hypothetical protein WKF34_08755 [Pyrinomonadaceae bacterium]
MAEIDNEKIIIVDERPAAEVVIVDETVTPEVIVVAEPPLVTIPVKRPRKVYGGMWGPLEIGAVTVSVMVCLLAAVIYFFWVVPSNNELARNRSEADRLEAELVSAKAKYGEITDTETQVARIVSSIDDFESRFLPVTSTGQSALYQRINGLIRGYGLVNTTGPDYTPLEAADQNVSGQSDEEKGREKFRSIYPGVYVTTTLEGSYQSLRRFIREIETGREFIIVSAVELAPSEAEREAESGGSQPNVVNVAPTLGGVNPAARTNPQTGLTTTAPPSSGTTRPRPRGKTHGEIVSLRIEMAAYFRRPNINRTEQ